MKKAEDYFDIMSSLVYMDCEEHRDDAYKLIRIVQEDTIRDAVEGCAENAELDSDSYENIYVDKNSILSVADKLIKELKDGNKD